MNTPPITRKTCTKCHTEKDIGAFSLSRGKPRADCKECKRAMDKAYRAANPEKIKAEKKAYHAANREKVNGQMKAYHAANPEKRMAKDKAYRAANPEKLKAKDKAYRAANPEKAKAMNDARRLRKAAAFATPPPTIEAAIRAGQAYRVVLHLPSAHLCSNSPPMTPGGRIVRAMLTKKYRNAARKACDQFIDDDGPLLLRRASAQLFFYFKNKRRRDIRNFEAGMKAAYDGLVDAKLITDDNSEVLTHEPTVFAIDAAAPRVEIIITPLDCPA